MSDSSLSEGNYFHLLDPEALFSVVITNIEIWIKIKNEKILGQNLSEICSYNHAKWNFESWNETGILHFTPKCIKYFITLGHKIVRIPINYKKIKAQKESKFCGYK